jgi:hypothetical protein
MITFREDNPSSAITCAVAQIVIPNEVSCFENGVSRRIHLVPEHPHTNVFFPIPWSQLTAVRLKPDILNAIDGAGGGRRLSSPASILEISAVPMRKWFPLSLISDPRFT